MRKNAAEKITAMTPAMRTHLVPIRSSRTGFLISGFGVIAAGCFIGGIVVLDSVGFSILIGVDGVVCFRGGSLVLGVVIIVSVGGLICGVIILGFGVTCCGLLRGGVGDWDFVFSRRRLSESRMSSCALIFLNNTMQRAMLTGPESQSINEKHPKSGIFILLT